MAEPSTTRQSAPRIRDSAQGSEIAFLLSSKLCCESYEVAAIGICVAVQQYVAEEALVWPISVFLVAVQARLAYGHLVSSICRTYYFCGSRRDSFRFSSADSMKYLVPCPACGRKSGVATGQAGQILQCACGEQFEVPTIRKLRELEPAEEEPLAPIWTMRKGLLFIGGLVTICSVAFAAVIWLYRPRSFIRRGSMFDQKAVDEEVQALSPAESFRRIVLIQPQMRSTGVVRRASAYESGSAVSDAECPAIVGFRSDTAPGRWRQNKWQIDRARNRQIRCSNHSQSKHSKKS